MIELGLTLFDLIWLGVAGVTSVVCAGINAFSTSKRERHTQFHSLWYLVDGKNAVAKNSLNQMDFEA